MGPQLLVSFVQKGFCMVGKGILQLPTQTTKKKYMWLSCDWDHDYTDNSDP